MHSLWFRLHHAITDTWHYTYTCFLISAGQHRPDHRQLMQPACCNLHSDQAAGASQQIFLPVCHVHPIHHHLHCPCVSAVRQHVQQDTRLAPYCCFDQQASVHQNMTCRIQGARAVVHATDLMLVKVPQSRHSQCLAMCTSPCKCWLTHMQKLTRRFRSFVPCRHGPQQQAW